MIKCLIDFIEDESTELFGELLKKASEEGMKKEFSTTPVKGHHLTFLVKGSPKIVKVKEVFHCSPEIVDLFGCDLVVLVS